MEAEDSDLRAEDDAIASLEAKGGDQQFCDYDFIPHPRSLYVNEHFVPSYDQGVHNDVAWCRPLELFAEPQYFKTASYTPNVQDGRLDDRWLLGVFAALASHSMELIEMLFCSRPEDFRKYGVYTCRFYKEGEWRTVMTDTRLPCLAAETTAGNKTKVAVMYGTSLTPGEMWVALLEKVYAKFLGSYEAIHDGYIADALMHLTGGVTTHFGLQLGSKPQKFDFDMVFEEVVAIPPSSAVMVCEYVSPGEDEASEPSELGIVSRRPYTIIRFVQVADVRLVLLRTPWEGSAWNGPWAAHDRAWEDYPDVARMFAEDQTLTPFWTVNDSHCICMLYSDFWREFSDLYVCRLFDDDAKQYSVVGQWRGKFAGGPRQVVRSNGTDGNNGQAAESKQREDDSERKDPGYCCNPTASSARVPTVVDGETSWFLNPQYAITCDAPCSITISLMLLGQPASKQANHRRIHPGFEVMKIKRSAVLQRVWECSPTSLLATVPDKVHVLHKMSSEAVLGAVNIDPKYVYIITPHTSAKGREARFLLRTFSSSELSMVQLPEPHFQLLPGAWHRNSELDTAGGPLVVRKKPKNGTGYENAVSTRWNQNPQYLLKLPSSLGPARINVKIIVRKTDKEGPKHGPKKRGHGNALSSSEKKSVAVGLVVTMPAIPPSTRRRRPKQDGPRVNALGERVVSRAAKADRRTLPGTGESNDELAPLEGNQVTVQHAIMSPDQEGRVARKLTVTEGEWYLQTHFADPSETCIFFQGVSRTWLKDGMLITPCLAERGGTGYFEVEVHSEVPVELLQLPDAVAKSLTGEWNTQTAGGSHLHKETWKNNPKYVLRFSDRTTAKRIHIMLSRPAQDWLKANKKDPVGSMLGFYIFSTPRPSRGSNSIIYDGSPWSETAFVPVHEVSTPMNFVLPAPATQEEDFTIMPCTLDPGHTGPFFLSVVCDAEFSIQHSRNRS